MGMEVSLSSAQFFEIGTTIVCMIFLKKAFLSEPKNILYIRIAFGISSTIHILLAVILRLLISRCKIETKFKFRPESSSFMNMNEANETEEVEKSYYEYDKEEADKYIRSLLFQTAIYVFLSYKFEVIQPLIMKTVNIIKFLFLHAPVWGYFYKRAIK